MRFGILVAQQLPRPWAEDAEATLFNNALEQVELADRLGIDYAWEIEHHFLEELSHSSAPEVFLAACSQRTKRIRLGHGIRHVLPHYSHPARTAECLATLDILSGGRVEFGTGESSIPTELEGFGVNPQTKRQAHHEAVEQICELLASSPYPGFEGEFFSMPRRNLVPKPLQKPHPPLWMACTRRETVTVAGHLGVGALCFAFTDPRDVKGWVDDYYAAFKSSECRAVGRAVNPNIAVTTSLALHPDPEEAARRGAEGFEFFKFALMNYVTGAVAPGETNLWERFTAARESDPNASVDAAAGVQFTGGGGIGTPAEVGARLRIFEEAGVDQAIFIHQVGNNRHEDICESIELLAHDVMPEFLDRTEAIEARKREEMAPFSEAALKRKGAGPAS